MLLHEVESCQGQSIYILYMGVVVGKYSLLRTCSVALSQKIINCVRRLILFDEHSTQALTSTTTTGNIITTCIL